MQVLGRKAVEGEHRGSSVTQPPSPRAAPCPWGEIQTAWGCHSRPLETWPPPPAASSSLCLTNPEHLSGSSSSIPPLGSPRPAHPLLVSSGPGQDNPFNIALLPLIALFPLYMQGLASGKHTTLLPGFCPHQRPRSPPGKAPGWRRGV